MVGAVVLTGNEPLRSHARAVVPYMIVFLIELITIRRLFELIAQARLPVSHLTNRLLEAPYAFPFGRTRTRHGAKGTLLRDR
jgi:hypothetical protein